MGHKRKSASSSGMSAFGGKADVIRAKAAPGFDAALQQQMAAGVTGIPGALLGAGGTLPA